MIMSKYFKENILWHIEMAFRMSTAMKNISMSVSSTYYIAHGKVMSIFAIYLHSIFHLSQEAGFFSSPFFIHK